MLGQVVTTHGQTWAKCMTCFTTRQCQLDCMLQARHDVADVVWYALRTWVECVFKDSKRGRWHREQAKMTDPARVEWL
jgi:hypothetical protein